MSVICVFPGVKCSPYEFDTMLKALAGSYRLFAPVRISGRGRCSDTDTIRYGEIRSVTEIEYREKSHFSPKELIFPIMQTLFYFTEEICQEPAVDDRGIIIFLRACDIHGFERLDAVFLHNGSARDVYYARLREKVKFVLLECHRSFRNCFCVSMGANCTDDFNMAIRITEDGILAQVRDEVFAQAMPTSVESDDFTPEFVHIDAAPVEVPELGALTMAIREHRFFDHPMWKAYADRCIACGRCTASCISCSCFTTIDFAYDDTPDAGERRRVWASCHVDRFTEMAGGHRFREDYGSRMRYKTMHKIYDYRQRFGQNMCVGCGRCDDRCPEYLAFSVCLNTISQVLKEGGGHDRESVSPHARGNP